MNLRVKTPMIDQGSHFVSCQISLCLVSSFVLNLVLMWMRSHIQLTYSLDDLALQTNWLDIFHMCGMSHKQDLERT